MVLKKAVDNDLKNKQSRSRAIRRLVIWYRRNSAVTTLVDSAASSATAASNVAESVVSNAGSVVTSAGSLARSTLQPLVFDPLKRLQGGDSYQEKQSFKDSERIWIAVDGMGGDNAPSLILEGCLKAISRLPLRIRFVGETVANKLAKSFGSIEDLMCASKEELEEVDEIGEKIAESLTEYFSNEVNRLLIERLK